MIIPFNVPVEINEIRPGDAWLNQLAAQTTSSGLPAVKVEEDAYAHQKQPQVTSVRARSREVIYVRSRD